MLRVATYNVRGCVGMDQRRSEERIAEVIAESGADIAGLQEVDLGRKRSARVDQAATIAAQLGWHHLFHPAMRHSAQEHYGDAIISSFPLALDRAGELPGPAPFFCRETRGVLRVVAQTNIGAVYIINTHFGLGRLERLQQAQQLAAEWFGADSAMPLLLLGDLNSLPGSRPHRALAERLRDVRELVPTPRAFRTFPTSLPALAVDHIFVNKHLRPLSLTVHKSALSRMASDHFPLVAELVRA